MDSPPIDQLDRRKVLHVGGLVTGLIIVGVFLAIAFPQVAGADGSYVVTSDSMSPAINAGSVVFVDGLPADELSDGDVITYQISDERVTHRVVAVRETDDGREFKTKGDANEQPDPGWVPADRVIGVVAFAVPLVGYVVSFANSDAGLLALVVIPAVLLIISELWDLFRAPPSESEDGVGP
ncbi:signal peptidase I [Halosimplex rubrum]|uniref:Signal peptidase I n=2 Tax=Halosimplex rubrum TaxID=869889 RepID=A0A7D5T8V8_9EURY|nr:signal peptidase I [Halosimplex rubrum]